MCVCVCVCVCVSVCFTNYYLSFPLPLHCQYGQNGLDWNAEQQKNSKSKKCTHRVAYKSILLARADAKFLGFKIDDNLTETIWEKFKSDRIEVGSCSCSHT